MASWTQRPKSSLLTICKLFNPSRSLQLRFFNLCASSITTTLQGTLLSSILSAITKQHKYYLINREHYASFVKCSVAKCEQKRNRPISISYVVIKTLNLYTPITGSPWKLKNIDKFVYFCKRQITVVDADDIFFSSYLRSAEIKLVLLDEMPASGAI